MKITATNLRPGDVYGPNGTKKVLCAIKTRDGRRVLVTYVYRVVSGCPGRERVRWYRQAILPVDRFAVNKTVEIERNQT